MHDRSEKGGCAMKRLKFKVTLLSDIIINQKAASKGPNKTLDYIPGSNFMGITAAKIYKETNADTLYLFHSGHVRFGDAHLAEGKTRSHKVPAAMFYPKLQKPSDELYISYKTDDRNEAIRAKQLKQCREGFYFFAENEAMPATISKTFAIKSAHDIETRTSRDKEMYGYESLSEGSTMLFEVEVDDEKYAATILDALTGVKRVGRSRTAQYGLVNIEKVNDYVEVCSHSKIDNVVVYADSRLVFLDENGCCTCQPTLKQLGLESGRIVWEKSQIRTFQYSPWNFKRKCFDADRYGIEKGSVIVVENVQECPDKTAYVGSYKTEGFGRIIYNPDFLESKENGKAVFKILSKVENEESSADKVELCKDDSPLLNYVKHRFIDEQLNDKIYKHVNAWMDSNKFRFKGKSFASQWSTIRSMSTRGGTDIKKEVESYLTHGVAQQKWNERGRKKAFDSFIKEYTDNETCRLAIINLAAEMAKYCRKEDKK